MSNVVEFDKLDDLLEHMAKSEQAAIDAMESHPIKVSELQEGDYFLSARPDMGIVIYGQVVLEYNYGPLPEDPEEAVEAEAERAFDRQSMIESRSRGYIFGRHFSVNCKEGELGETHITQIHMKLLPEVFERARANGFRHLNQSN